MSMAAGYAEEEITNYIIIIQCYGALIKRGHNNISCEHGIGFVKFLTGRVPVSHFAQVPILYHVTL